jgi:hypothetical protein
MITLKSIIANSKSKSVLNEVAMNPVKKVVNAILKKHNIEAMKTYASSVRGAHNIIKGGYRYEGDYFLGFYGNVPQDVIEKIGAEMKKAGVKGVDVRKGIISADFTKTGLSEAKDETYFKSATDAVMYARTQAEKRGFEINDEDWNSEITMGGRYSRTRPGVGKTNSFSVGLLKGGKPQRKNLNISLYGMESGKFELTYYIN